MDDLYLEPNRRAQVIVLLAIIFAALLAASLNPIINYLTPSQSAPLQEQVAATRLMLFLALCTNVIAFIIALFWVVHFGRQGYLTLKLGSYPPSGTIVVRRTKVRTGRQAIFAGYLSILFAVLVAVVFGVPCSYVLWQLICSL
ncbi:MAG: hypothetical protein KKH12_03715 [Gammaproteobacteria bacterium]|nr:hypothetical protein [Gammaproteobacteria bacterium]MBU1480763.1 hypothetical protein [Gammaproteobacteria bacterium]